MTESVRVSPQTVFAAYQKAVDVQEALLQQYAPAMEREAQKRKEKQQTLERRRLERRLEREEKRKAWEAAVKARDACEQWERDWLGRTTVERAEKAVQSARLELEMIADESLFYLPEPYRKTLLAFMKAAVVELRGLHIVALVATGDFTLSQDDAQRVGAVLSGDFEKLWGGQFAQLYKETGE